MATNFILPCSTVHHYAVAVVHLIMQNFNGQRILHQPLDSALQGPRTEVGIIALTQQ